MNFFIKNKNKIYLVLVTLVLLIVMFVSGYVNKSINILPDFLSVVIKPIESFTTSVVNSFSGDEEIKKAVNAGIRKMNFATDICYAFLDKCYEELGNPDRAVAVDTFMKEPIRAVEEFCISRIKLVGADGKG